MISLAKCLLKHGAGLDANGVREAAKSYAARGEEDKAANIAAVQDKLNELAAEENRIIGQVAKAYAKDTGRTQGELLGEAPKATAVEALKAKKATEEKAAMEKAPEGKFVLTGSERAADEAEARGQQPMFSLAKPFYSALERGIEKAAFKQQPAAG